MRPSQILAVMLGGCLALLLMAAPEPSGTISADPNPCVIEPGHHTCTAFVTWSTQDVRHARVFVVAEGSRGREEKEFSASRSCERCQAPWIEKARATFTLYDYSSGRRGRALSAVTVSGTPAR